MEDPHAQIGTYTIGKVSLPIYGGLVYTLEKARRFFSRSDGRRDMLLAYSYITGDTRSALPLNSVFQAMLGEVQLIWYEMSGKPVPAQVTANQEGRMAKAQKAQATDQGEQEAQETTATKAPRITNRSIIENGLLAGKDTETILAEVKQQFPDGKADAKHVAYYRHFLEKQGKLEKAPKPVKEPKAKKVKAEGEEPAPAKVQKQAAAQPGQAKTKQAAPPVKPGRQTVKAGR